MEMRRPKNESSHIHSIGFDEETGTLAVKFHKGGTYHYHGVDAETARGLYSSGSCGEFFCNKVKGKFKHQRAGR